MATSSRKLGLNDYLISRVSGCRSFEALLIVLRHLIDDCWTPALKGILDAEIDEGITRRVWKTISAEPKAKWSGEECRCSDDAPWETVSEQVFGPNVNRNTGLSAFNLLSQPVSDCATGQERQTICHICKGHG